jgi:hypothetical protein
MNTTETLAERHTRIASELYESWPLADAFDLVADVAGKRDGVEWYRTKQLWMAMCEKCLATEDFEELADLMELDQ